jgi:hypothetical protein
MNRRMRRNKMLADAGLIVGVSWVQPARLSAHPRLAGADPCLPTGWIIVCCRRYGAPTRRKLRTDPSVPTLEKATPPTPTFMGFGQRSSGHAPL